MPAGGRRPGAGGKPGPKNVAPTVRQVVAQTVQNNQQHREALREHFRAFMTPQRLTEVLTGLYEMATEPGSRAERFRAIDLLLRLAIGNPAVYGEATEAHAGDGARSLAELVSALPPGTALVRQGAASSATPGDYASTPAEAPPLA